jgi:hypothetical protein
MEDFHVGLIQASLTPRIGYTPSLVPALKDRPKVMASLRTMMKRAV